MTEEDVPESLEADEATKEDYHYNRRPMNEKHYKFSRYLFPHWVIYVAWFVCVFVIVTSALLTMICGLAFGRVKSLVWIGCVTLIFLVSFLLVQPVKVLLIALLFSLVWKRPYNQSLMDETRSECQRQENLHFMSFGDRRKYRRTQRMYRPVPLGDYKRLREKEQIRAKLVDMSRDLFLYSVYLITLLWVAMADVDDIAFYSTQSILRMVIGGNYAGKDSVKFEGINSVNSLVSYINLTLLPALHASKWYNGADLGETGTTADMTTRLLGVPRLRQLRTILDSCKRSGAISSQSDCSSEISSSNMDSAISWTTPIFVPGEYATYHGGGYVSPLGRNLKNSQVVLKFLQNFNWLDHHTRAVFIEFTTYNINRNLFNVVHLLTEWSVSSAWTTSYNTVKLLVLGGEHGTMWLISSLLFLLMLCLLMLRQFLILRKVSSREFFKSWWNIIDIIIIALGFSATLFYFFRSIYVSSLIKMLEAADGNEFVSFFFAVQYDFLLTVLIAILVCLSTGRLWKLLRFGESFRTVETTIIQAVSSMVTLTICMGLFLLAFSGVVHLLMGHVIKEYRKFFYTFTALFYFSVGIGEHFEFEELYKVNSLMGPILFFLFCVVVSIYLTNIFMSVLMAYYSASQIHIQLMREDYNLLDYFRDEWAYLISRFSWRSTQCPRLRGGEDVQEYLPLVVPKPMELWSMNTQEITIGRLRTMCYLALARARKDLSMAALVEDIIKTNEDQESEGTKRFHVGVDYEGQQMVQEDTLEAMEAVVNRLSRIPLVRKEEQKAQEDSAIHLLNERLENVLENIVSLERQTRGDWNSSSRLVVPTIEPSNLVWIDKNRDKLPKHANEMRAYSTENISEIIHEPEPAYVSEEISQRTYKKQIFGTIYTEAPKSCITLVDKIPDESELRKLNKLEKSNVEEINASSKVDSRLSCLERTRHQRSSSSTSDSYQLLHDISSDYMRRDVGVGFSTTLDQLYKDVQQRSLESTSDSYQQLQNISTDCMRTDVAGGFDTNFENVFSLCDKKHKDDEEGVTWMNDEKKTGESEERPTFPKFKSASLPNIPSRVDFLNKGALMHHLFLNDEERSNSWDSLNSTDSGVSVGLKDVFR
uniref:Uncharacterized protein n=1 Tax=Timema cristinae TaxID=61476 RepID=A0A7R9CTX8_TIMCR|nr:unnamed protein product [Timema cristinae]